MEKFFICLAVAIIAILFIIVINIYNKLQYTLIKLDKAEVNIKDALNKKYQILIRYIELLNGLLTLDEDLFSEFSNLNIKSISSINLLLKIDDCCNVIKKILDDNEKLLKNEAISNINKEIIEQDIIINSCKNYYNNKLVNYNKLIKCFPTKYIAMIWKYKEKKFYPEYKEENLKILED